MKKIAIAFGGGGSRIIEWANVPRLMECHYEIEAVSGVSSGCFMAMNIAAGLSPDEVVESLRENYPKYNSLKFSPKWHLGHGLFSTEAIGNAMAEVCAKRGIHTMADFPMPIVVKATDCQSGDIVLFTNLNLESSVSVKVIKNASPKDAIMASCAFPFVYKAVKVTDDDGNPVLCLDGGLRGNLCVLPLKKALPDLPVLGCMFNLKPYTKKKHFISILDRTIRGSNRVLTCQEMQLADKVIMIPKLSGVGLLDTKCQYFDDMLKFGTIYIVENKLFNVNWKFTMAYNIDDYLKAQAVKELHQLDHI